MVRSVCHVASTVHVDIVDPTPGAERAMDPTAHRTSSHGVSHQTSPLCLQNITLELAMLPKVPRIQFSQKRMKFDVLIRHDRARIRDGSGATHCPESHVGE